MREDTTAGCLSFEELEAHLAEEGSNEKVSAHLAGCESCRQHLAEMRQNNELMNNVIGMNRDSHLAIPQEIHSSNVSVSGYEILEEIHRGGQGVVYRAHHVKTNRTVALKVILQGALATSRQRHRFEREIEVVAALRHSAIVTVYDTGTTEDGRLFFSMEFVDGDSLDRVIQNRSRSEQGITWPLQDRLRLFMEVCDGVLHAHRRGVIHRDLKPGNIMIDREGHGRVLDFGLAKAVGNGGTPGPLATVTGEFMGTLSYAAPEQVQGDTGLVDTRTDVFALGVILYELLTGRRPFCGKGSVSDVVKAITERDPEPPSSQVTRVASGRLPASAGTRTPRVDKELDAIVLKALAKDPDRRYQSVEVLRRDIVHFLAGEPIEAKRDSTWYLLRKTVRRYRTAAAVIAALAVLSLVYAVTMSFLYGRAITAEHVAASEAQKAREVADVADRQAAKATAINEFLLRMLESADPQGTNPTDVTIRELLEKAVARIEDELGDQPQVAAAVHRSIGNTYRNLALFDKAAFHLRAAVKRAEEAVGKEHIDYATSLMDLGLLLHDRGKYEEAEPMLREAVDLCERLGDIDNPALATARGNLAVLLYSKGDLKGAEVLFRKTLEADRRNLGNDHPDLVYTLVNVAAVASANENYSGAVELNKEALGILEKAFPNEPHPLKANVKTGLGINLDAMGDQKAAEPMFRQALAINRKVYGDRHPAVAESMSALGAMLRDAGTHPDEAEELLTEAVAQRREFLGPTHPLTGVSINDLALLMQSLGKHDRAEPLFREAVEVLRKSYPPNHWEIAYVESPLGATLAALGRFEEAETLLLRSYAIIEKERGERHRTTIKSAERVVAMYESWGKPAAARKWREKLAAITPHK